MRTGSAGVRPRAPSPSPGRRTAFPTAFRARRWTGSRSALPDFAETFPRLKVVLITARPDVLAARLAARGRESGEAIARRLERAVPEIVITADTVVIDNSGPLEAAGEAFVELLASTLAGRG